MKYINDDLRRVDNMKGKIASISLIAIAWLGAVNTANGYEIDCPAKINIKFDHPELENIPDGWQVSDKKDRSLALSSLGVYSDEPVKLFQLKPEIGIIDDKKHDITWQVNSVYDEGGSYVSCGYNGDEVQLVKKIDSSMKSCWADYSNDKNQAIKVKLICSTSELQKVK